MKRMKSTKKFKCTRVSLPLATAMTAMALGVGCTEFPLETTLPPEEFSVTSQLTDVTGTTTFDVYIRYTAMVPGEAVQRLIDQMRIIEGPAEMMAGGGDFSADPLQPLDSNRPGVAVTLLGKHLDVDVSRYVYTWPDDFAPAELPGVLIHGDMASNPTVETVEPSPNGEVEVVRGALSAEREWWGVRLKLSRNEICTYLRAGEVVGRLAGWWVPYLSSVIWAQKVVLNQYVGTNGIRIELTWAGIPKKIAQRGSDAACFTGADAWL